MTFTCACGRFTVTQADDSPFAWHQLRCPWCPPPPATPHKVMLRRVK